MDQFFGVSFFLKESCIRSKPKLLTCEFLDYTQEKISTIVTPMSSSADTAIRSFCNAWSEGSLEEIMGFFDENAIYHNIPMEPAEGLEQIRAFIEGFFAMATSIQFEILHQVATETIVMNERIDTLVIGDATTVLPVMGIFELKDGKIIKWRDYFDMGQLSGN